MAISASLLANVSSSTDASSYATGSLAPTNGRLVLALVCNSKTTAADLPTLSGGGVTTWTQVATRQGTGDNRFRVTLFRAQQTSYGGAAAVTASFGGNTQARCAILVVEFSGTNNDAAGNGALCLVQNATNEATSTTPSVSFSAFQDAGNGAFAGWYCDSSRTYTAGTGYTELAESGVHETVNAQVEWRADNDTNADATLSASGYWLGIGVEIRVPYTVSGAAAADVAITAAAAGGFVLSGAAAADVAIAAAASADTYSAAEPDMSVEFGYTAAPLDALSTVVWTDVTDDCRSWNIRRGRQHELQQFDAGTAVIVMDNRERAYDPEQLSLSLDGYLDLDGSSNCRASTNDHADLDVTGDIDFRAAFSMVDPTPASVTFIAGKWDNNFAFSNSYKISIATDGKVNFVWTTDGITPITRASTVALTLSPGQGILVKATLDVDNGAGGHTVTFYTKAYTVGAVEADLAANTGWSILGSAVTNAGATSIRSAIAPINVGDNFDDARLTGQVFGLCVKSGIDGTTVTDPDFTQETSTQTSIVDNTGKTYTCAGTAEIVPLTMAASSPALLQRVRISTVYQGTTYRHFTGYVESLQFDYVKGPTNDRGDAVAIVRAVDATKLLNLMHFDSSHFREEVLDLTPDLYWPLDDEATLTARDLSGNGRTGSYATEVERGVPTTYPLGEDGGACVVTSLATITRPDTVNYERTQAFTVGFIARFDQDEATDGIILGSFNPTSPYKGWFVSVVDGRFVQMNLLNSASNKIERQAMLPIQDARQHLVIITYSGSSAASGVSIYIDGVAIGAKSITDALGANSIVDANAEFSVGGPEASSAVSHVFVIPDDITSTQAETIYNAMVYPFEKRDPADFVGRLLDFLGWPSADRDLPEGGTTLDGPLTSFRDPLPLIQAIATSEFGGGGFYVKGDGELRLDHRYSLTGTSVIDAVFGDEGAESNEARYMEINPIFDDTDLWTEVHIETDKGSNPVILTDPTSEALYFKRAMTVGGLWASSEIARAVGQRLLERFSGPRLRFPDIDLPQGIGGSSRFLQMLSRDLNDRLTVKRRPTGGGSVITQECWVEGVTLGWRPKRWRMTMQLTPADSAASYFTLGTSKPTDAVVLGE